MAQPRTQVLQPEDNIVSPLADGREYRINLGESFKRGLESSEKLFHTLQYSWKPTSVNEEERGVLQYQPDAELVAEYKNKESEEVWLFRGQYKKCKETECVLIFDGTSFTLERLSGYGMVKPTKSKVSHIPATLPDIQSLRKAKRSLSDTEAKVVSSISKRQKIEPVNNGTTVTISAKAAKAPKKPAKTRAKKAPKTKKAKVTEEKEEASWNELETALEMEFKEEEDHQEIEEISEDDEELEAGGLTTTTTYTIPPMAEEPPAPAVLPTTGGKGLSAISIGGPAIENALRSPLSESSSDNDSSSESESESESDSESDALSSGSSSQSSSDSESDSDLSD